MRSMSADLARRALEAGPDAMLIVDGTGTIRFSNRKTEEIFGYRHDEIVGLAIENLLPERFRARHGAHRQHFFDSGRARPMGMGLDLYALRKDGSEFPVEISLSPLEDNGHALVAAAIRDVTERKAVDTELRVLQAIADTALASESSQALIGALLARLRSALGADTATILLLDADGQHLTPYASDGLEAEVGGEIQIPIGQGLAGRIALSDGPVIFEDLSGVEIVSPVLRSRVQSLVGMPLRSGRHLVGVVHTGSFTRRSFKDHHARLLSRAADRIGLAIERARLQESEQAARRAAETANRQKSSFLATASHDLRQPLQTLSLFNGALRRLLPAGEAADALDGQEMAIDAMARLLNALLDISKLESGAIKPDPSDFLVSEIFEELRHEFVSLAESKGLALNVAPSEASAHSDASLVTQILRNLLTNAIKYTRSGWVALRCLHEQSWVRLEVLDSGIGIPADKLQYIYDEFYQVGVPTNNTRDGYGLGLSIVQRIANLLNAKLDVQSELGKGSLFALTLPVASFARPRLRAITRPTAAAARSRTRVLLVEDDHAVRNATRMLLKSEGFQVVAAGSLEDALQQVAGDEPIDLLVTDYHLQDGKTGLDVIAAVRSAINPRLKTVLLTGDTSSAIMQLSRDGLMRVASKPINAEHLVSLLKSLLATA